MNKLKEFINSKNIKINYTNNKLNIVNFDKINFISDNTIILLKDSKSIIIKGEELSLLKLLDFEVLIGGHIKTIEL